MNQGSATMNPEIQTPKSQSTNTRLIWLNIHLPLISADDFFWKGQSEKMSLVTVAVLEGVQKRINF